MNEEHPEEAQSDPEDDELYRHSIDKVWECGCIGTG
jgi:hypothetical protein